MAHIKEEVKHPWLDHYLLVLQMESEGEKEAYEEGRVVKIEFASEHDRFTLKDLRGTAKWILEQCDLIEAKYDENGEERQ